jgi:uncharacterized protein
MRRRRCFQALGLLLILSPLGIALLRPPAQAQLPREEQLAIVIDDLGYDRADADALATLPIPLTVAVLPDLAHSTEVAERAWRQGREVLLHLPMEARADTGRRAGVGLRPGMDDAEVDAVVGAMLETVPHAIGVSNHRGSRATADRPLMEALTTVLGKRGLFLIDSRTTTATVALVTAQRAGVRVAARNVFLDNIPERRAILGQLELAALHARRSGATIAIGHPHPATIAALGEGLPRLEAQGVRLVFASDVVQ